MAALTIYLIDRLAVELRTVPGVSEKQLSLCAILYGGTWGTWATGRDIAMRLRPRSIPPLNLVTDGTVF